MGQETTSPPLAEKDLHQLQAALEAHQEALRQAQERLREADVRFYRLLNLMPDAVLIIDDGGHIRYANQQAADLVGVGTAEALVNRSVLDFVAPGDRLPAQSEEERLRLGQRVENRQLHIMHVSGREVPIEASAVPISYEGAAAVLGRAQDLSGQRRMEKALSEKEDLFRKIFQLSPAGITISRLSDGAIVEANDAAVRMAGLTREEFEQQPFFERWINPAQRADLIRQIEAGQVIEHLEVEEYGSDNVVKVYRGSFQPIQVGDEQCLLSVVLDVTEQKQTEHELIEAKERAEDIARLRSIILNNITHEVRTPLTVILGFTSMLRKGVQPQFQRFVNLIERSGRRLMLMLDAILDLAQLEVGTLEIVPTLVDVTEIVEGAATMLRPQAEDKGLRLKVRMPSARMSAELDHRILSRILNNLLDNAIKFTEEGYVQVDVSAKQERIRIRIKDTGVGIDEMYLSNIFDEFSQESTGLERTYQGSGLGLAVTRRLIEVIGGNITVDSNKGKGSVFTVDLPRYLPADS